MLYLSGTERDSALIGALALDRLSSRHNTVMLLFLSMMDSRPLTDPVLERRYALTLIQSLRQLHASV